MKIINNSFLLKFFPRSIVAFALGSTIYCRTTLPERLFWHEVCHVLQYKKYGILRFLFIYFIKELFVPYREKRFEVEAYSVHTKEDLLDIYSEYLITIEHIDDIRSDYYAQQG